MIEEEHVDDDDEVTRQNMLSVLMVAEKPSIAQTLTSIMSTNASFERHGATPVHQFRAEFMGAPASFTVTSVVGHIYSVDFPSEFQNWHAVEPLALFDAPTRRKEANKKIGICRHLERVARQCHVVVLWLDCDREGENICFEVLDNTVSHLIGGKLPASVRDDVRAEIHRMRRIFRAKFSALTRSDVDRAMAMGALVSPNLDEARAVDARQVIDLKVGVAYTRFQNMHFHERYGNLNSAMISFGPCQSPALNFCVERHDSIAQFRAERFWTLVARVRTAAGQMASVEWQRGRLFDQQVCAMFAERVNACKGDVARLVSTGVKQARKPRPMPLNTVALLKHCSSALGIGPHQAMHVAERLYIQGYITYPRTESTRYPDSVDLDATLRAMTSHSLWGACVSELLAGARGSRTPRGGIDAGDHPPITPMRSASSAELADADWRVYEFVARNFVASLSPDAIFERTAAVYELACGERFTSSGVRLVRAGWTALMPHAAVRNEGITEHVGDATLLSAAMSAGETSAPDFLTESELISLMERHGIGTDASIATHINTICERNFVRVGGHRQLRPTELGVTLVHGYYRVDPDMVLPDVRAHIERYIDLIATGRASYDTVVRHAVAVFRAKFEYFMANIGRMDELFEARFAPVAETKGKPFSKCGKCLRYMKIIYCRPTRLYCTQCDATYALPQVGAIRLAKQTTCPLDGFELLLHVVGCKPPKSQCFCPYCFANPQFEDMGAQATCDTCTHPTCRHGAYANALFPCPEPDCIAESIAMSASAAAASNEGEQQPQITQVGTVIFDPRSGPAWRGNCNRCKYVMHLPERAHRMKPASKKCEHCGTTILSIDFNKNNTPLPDGETLHRGCLFCDPLIAQMCREGHTGKFVSTKYKRKHKRRKNAHLLRH
jgi:DNA topoisomerase III